MNNILNIYLLSSDWIYSHRKSYIRNIERRFGKTIVIQFPLSLTVNLFIKFKSKFLGFMRGKHKPHLIDESIYLFTPFMIFHKLLWIKFKLLAIIDSKIISFQINKYIRKNFPDYVRNFWIYVPADYYLTKFIEYDNLIYDYYDDTEYDNMGKKMKNNIDLNKKLVPKCDLVICISEFTTNKMLELNKKSIRTVSGYDSSLFNSEYKINKTELDKLDKPVIGYAGVLRNYNDYKILKYILEKTDYYLVCIGYIDRSFKNEYKLLRDYKNFVHIQYKPIEEVPYFIKKFNVGILPYSINNFTKSVYPYKIYEYMAMGIPIVSTALPELKKYDGIIGYSNTKEGFIDNCIKAVNGYYNVKLSEYKRIILENSWEKVFDIIEENLLDVYKQKSFK